MDNKEYPHLTKKAAKALAVQMFGTAKGLTKVKNVVIDTYEMKMGELAVTIQHDWFWHTGDILMFINHPHSESGSIYLLFSPKTLKEDFAAEERLNQRRKRESLQDWVRKNGPEACKAEIDKANTTEYAL